MKLDWSLVKKGMLPIGLIGAGVIIGIIIGMSQQHSSGTPSGRSGNTTATSAKKTANESTTNQVGQASGAAKAATDAITVPDTTACKFLTPTIARQILGASTAFDTAHSTTSKTSDLENSSCAYTSSSNDNITLSAHAPLSSLGTSENALAFGSAKPAGVTDVSGYGQSAYWDPAKATLNILDNNTWLVLSRTKSSASAGISDVTAVAESIKQEL